METTVFIIHSDSWWDSLVKGSHVAVSFSNPGVDNYGDTNEKALYDPSGSYEANTGYGNGKYRSSSGVFSGDVPANIDDYINSVLNRDNGEYIVSYTINTTPEQEAAMIEKAHKTGDGFGFSCAMNVSNVLGEIGFDYVLTPGGLEKQLKKVIW